MGESPKTVQEQVKASLYNNYLHEMMRRLELKGITLHKHPDFDWAVYGSHFDEFSCQLIEDIKTFESANPTKEQP